MVRRKIVVALGNAIQSGEATAGAQQKRWKNGGTTCENNGK